MSRFLSSILNAPKLALVVLIGLALWGARTFTTLPVDVFPDIRAPQVVIQTEAGGLSAEEVQDQVTRPLESTVNGIPGVTGIRSSSSGGLSFVWVDFDWSTDLSRARFEVFERLSRVKDALPADAETEIAPVVSVTGEIMLVALTASEDTLSPLELRARAEFDLRNRLLAVPGIGEVVVIGGQLPEYRIEAEPRELAAYDLTFSDVIDAARNSRTPASAGYLANVAGDEVPLRQVARADTLDDLARLPIKPGTAIRLSDVAHLSLAGSPRRGSASFNGQPAVILSIQKTPGGNTPELTRELDTVLDAFAAETRELGLTVHRDAYRQADFIGASIAGGQHVLRDAVLIVIFVLALLLMRVRPLLIVLASIPISVLIALACFPAFGLGVNVMTIGGFAVAVGDIVDSAIIFTEVSFRRLSENARLPVEQRAPSTTVLAGALTSVLPGILFSTAVILLVFLPLVMLSGLEGQLFRPLGLAYILIFATSFLVALVSVPALARLLWRDSTKPAPAKVRGDSIATRALKAVYRPLLKLLLRAPIVVPILALILCAFAFREARTFGTSFLPPFREDSCNVSLSLPPGASLNEAERLAEAAVPKLREIPGVLSVTRRTGRAERDQHAEPVSSSEYIIRMDLAADQARIRALIRDILGEIPGASVVVGYPIAHRISAVLSGTEAEIAINVYGEDPDRLQTAVKEISAALEHDEQITDLRANREVSVRTLRIDYDPVALAEAGLTLREAGEQVSAAFNGLETGEIRSGNARYPVMVRLAGLDDVTDESAVRRLLLTGANGRAVRLDEVARIVPEETSNLLLREGGRRKALITCNPAADTNPGDCVRHLSTALAPIAARHGCSLAFTGSSTARDSAARRLAWLGGVLAVVIFCLVFCAVRSLRGAFIVLLNVPLGLVGGVFAVSLANPVLSVSSLIGFLTVSGFTLRNGILLLNRYRERQESGESLTDAIREGSLERMVPILMTSLTTVIGLIPLVLAENEPGGEMLAPLAIVQLGGILGATFLNLLVTPAVARLLLAQRRAPKAALTCGVLGLLLVSGCETYTPEPIPWTELNTQGQVTKPVVRLTSADDAARLAELGNPELGQLTLKFLGASAVAEQEGLWQDPSLEADLNRIVQSASHPFLGGINLAFTIPVNGASAFDKRAAERGAAAEAQAIEVAKRRITADARAAFVRLAAATRTQRLLAAYADDPRHERTEAQLKRLVELGEISVAEEAASERRHHAFQHKQLEAEAAIIEAEEELRAILGLVPTATFELPDVDAVFAETDTDTTLPDPLVFINHPRVQEKIRRHESTEEKLQAEIRRQYPDLKLGPAYSREDGLDRVGFVLGLDLPLWNRNRKAIAEARRDNREAANEAILEWRALVLEDAAARRRLAHLRAHPPVPHARRETLDNLLKIGEMLPHDYLAAYAEILNAELEEYNWQRDCALAREELTRTALSKE